MAGNASRYFICGIVLDRSLQANVARMRLARRINKAFDNDLEWRLIDEFNKLIDQLKFFGRSSDQKITPGRYGQQHSAIWNRNASGGRCGFAVVASSVIGIGCGFRWDVQDLSDLENKAFVPSATRRRLVVIRDRTAPR